MERTRRIRIGRLTTVGQVAAELGRLYRQARRGDVVVADASSNAQMLEASELERRIAEMEAALAPTFPPVWISSRLQCEAAMAAIRLMDPGYAEG